MVARKGFNCCNPFETREGYKEVLLTMWANDKYLNTSFVRQYFRAYCDVIAVIMATLKVHKKNSKFQFLPII